MSASNLARTSAGRRGLALCLVLLGVAAAAQSAAGAAASSAPDLAVQSLQAPRRVVRSAPLTVEATIAELRGASAADATVVLRDGPTALASSPVHVDAGASATVSLDATLTTVGAHRLVVSLESIAPADDNPTNDTAARRLRVLRYDVGGIVSTENDLATQIGRRVLARGGNAFDAAAAVQWALAVCDPHSNGIGGGATILAYVASTGQTVAIDAREPAPASASPDMFGAQRPSLLSTSGVSVGVPGTVRATAGMLARWGTRSLASTLRPAIRLAARGFVVGPSLAEATTDPRFRFFQPETVAVFRHTDGAPLEAGDHLAQPALARTLSLLARRGPSAFYGGRLAQAIVAAQTRASYEGGGGGMTVADLAGYQPVLRAPVAIDYHGYRVETAPPSSGGGLTLLETLRMLERFPLGDHAQGFGALDASTLHVESEALRLALADSRMWMGDDAVSPVPVAGLLSDGYTAQRSALIALDAHIAKATAGDPRPFQGARQSVRGRRHHGTHTSHFAVLDRFGNMVSFTTTLADGFGSGIMVPGYGFVLNDSLTNFNLRPHADPATGDPGINDAAPGKLPRGNTAPVIAFAGDEPILATGSPGGDWIPSVVLQVVSNVLDQHMTIHQAVDALRFWIAEPNGVIGWNRQIPADTIAALRALGDEFSATPGRDAGFGSAESIAVDPDTFAARGAADPRTPEASVAVLPPR
jgi:gamma-glutamyltranspeptidase / glutathione hydrolase